MNIIEALKDRNLLGASPVFADLATWKPWLVFLSAVYGLPLDSEGVDLFKRCTGRSTYDPPEGGWPEVAYIVDRQAGKTPLASDDADEAPGQNTQASGISGELRGVGGGRDWTRTSDLLGVNQVL